MNYEWVEVVICQPIHNSTLIIMSYELDLHCQMILEEYRDRQPVYEIIRRVASDQLRRVLNDNNIAVTGLESRIKTEDSLAGKLELKGHKYATISDLTDIVGVRVIAFYNDDVDKISALAESLFDVDWVNSVDKRKMHELDSFGYNSLHYICQIPKTLYFDPQWPEVNEIKFELQMRTTLQHMWASMYHDIGYKSGVEVPVEHLRTLNRLAGMLELADDEFGRIRTAINDYRRQVSTLVTSGNFDEVNLDGDSFKSYLQLKPFDKLNQRIAAINQAEIQPASAMPYLAIFRKMGFKTLGDIEQCLRNYGDDAYQLAVHQLGLTDLDIISSTLAVQNICIVHILENGGGTLGLKWLLDTLYNPSDSNMVMAEQIFEQASKLSFMNRV